jgi:hypothetical protein
MLVRTTYRATIAILSLILIYAPIAGASSSPTQYAVGITDGVVAVSFNLNMVQNITYLSFEKSFTLPSLHVLARGANSTGLAQLVQGALQSMNPKAQVSNLNLQIASSPWSNATNTQWLNMSLTFNVNGVTVSRGDAATTDLSWKSFRVLSGYTLGGVEVNRIGDKYFSGVAADLALHSGGSSFIQIFYHVNGVPLDPSKFPDAVRNMTVLDFSSFATPVSSWKESHVAPISESWSFADGQGLGMVYAQQVNEAGVLSTAKYGLFYDLSGSVTAPFGARVNGDTVTLVVGTLSGVIMAGIVVSTVGLWSGSYLFERRIQSKTARKRVKR